MPLLSSAAFSEFKVTRRASDSLSVSPSAVRKIVGKSFHSSDIFKMSVQTLPIIPFPLLKSSSHSEAKL